MGQSTSQVDFVWSTQQEPHKSRRTAILEKYPEMQKLFVLDTVFKWKVLVLVAIQFLSLYIFRDLPFGAILLLAYCLGGTINHSLLLAEHEISHGQAFGTSSPKINRVFGIFVNLPIGIPMACSFKKYHLLHHRYQGSEGMDTDLPTIWEGQMFRSPLMKCLWLFLQPAFYALRPFLVNPIPAAPMELFNVLSQMAFDAAVIYFFGWKMLFYMVAGTILSMGLHPMAGHFIAEHYLWEKDHETASYNGPMNKITWNVGYHMAHHDFPSIPGSLLPEVHRIAPEFYDHLPVHSSWVMCLVQFVLDPSLGPYARLKRTQERIED
jgi:sphingolipid delta-4 desaturase